MKLYIKNMTGVESIRLLRNLLSELSIIGESDIRLGEVILKSDTASEKVRVLRNKLDEIGMYLIFDRKNILSEKVKHLVYTMIDKNDMPDQNYSVFISSQLHLNYTYLANIFSETQGITVEHFIIRERIMKACQMLRNTGLTIGQISNKLHYSSIGHFSGQFKKVMNLTPSQYKKMLEKEQIGE